MSFFFVLSIWTDSYHLGTSSKPPAIDGLQVSPCAIAKEELSDEEIVNNSIDTDTTCNGSLQ